ncbi:MAG: hypothetical protein NTW19_12105 [Planctomycetota bacterium]|nr:hypothetical protein [Planctomycetota bacterium]
MNRIDTGHFEVSVPDRIRPRVEIIPDGMGNKYIYHVFDIDKYFNMRIWECAGRGDFRDVDRFLSCMSRERPNLQDVSCGGIRGVAHESIGTFQGVDYCVMMWCFEDRGFRIELLMQGCRLPSNRIRHMTHGVVGSLIAKT